MTSDESLAPSPLVLADEHAPELRQPVRAVQEREEVTEATMADEMLVAARELGGASWTKIRERVRGRADEAAAVRDRLLEDGRLVNTATRKGGFNLWAADDPAFRSEPGTDPERLQFPAPERGAADASAPRSHVLKGTGGTERNGVPGFEADEEPEPTLDEEPEPVLP